MVYKYFPFELFNRIWKLVHLIWILSFLYTNTPLVSPQPDIQQLSSVVKLSPSTGTQAGLISKAKSTGDSNFNKAMSLGYGAPSEYSSCCSINTMSLVNTD